MKLFNIIWQDVYNVMILAMTIITAVSAYVSKSQQLIIAAAIAIATALAVDAVINYAKTKKFDFSWKSPIVSGFIIALVLSTNKVYVIAVAAALAIVLKHIIRFEGKHIFNPANLALAIVPLILPASQGWAGSVIWWLPILLGLAVIYRLKRLELPATFLLVYLGLTTLSPFIFYHSASQVGIIASLASQSAAYFFGFFMLTEPKTSPDTQRGRVAFGIIAAVTAFALSFALPQYNFVLSLVVADLFVSAINRFT